MTAALLAEILRRMRQSPEIQLTGDQLRLLAALGALGEPVMISDAAAAAEINRPRASLATSALLKRGLIRRKADKWDQRVRILELTQKGREVCDKLSGLLAADPAMLCGIRPRVEKIWITDNKSTRLLSADQPIPDGWVKGRTFRRERLD